MTAKRRILVTGANGRIGRRVVAELENHSNVEVVPVGSPRAAGMVTLDISDADATTALIATEHPDVIIHLAGVLPSTGADFSINESSTRAVVDAARNAEVSRIVLASSAAVYGDSRIGALAETLEPLPTGAYGESKVAAEAALHAAPCETVALRIFNVYGPGFVDSLVERLIDSNATNPVAIGNLDEFVRDYVHVEDVAAATVAAATVSLTDTHNTINVGTGIPINNRVLVRMLAKNNDVHFSGGTGPLSYSVADTTLAAQVLGFRALRALDSRG